MTDADRQDQTEQHSLAERLADLEERARTRIIAPLSRGQLDTLLHDWRFWQRPDQAPPGGDWTCWLVLAGRGFGKTRMGAEWVRAQARDPAARIALAGASLVEARAVMVEGQSGLLAISAAYERPVYEPSKQRLTWPNGALGFLYSADQPERLRGPQHSAAWVDELAKCPNAKAFWDMLWMGLRLGDKPQVVATTTPRPSAFLKALRERDGTAVTYGATWANARNLAPGFIEEMKRRYAGTRLGLQELEGHYLDRIDGALWQPDQLDRLRCPSAPHLERIVVAVDPPVTSGPRADACGIIVAGIDAAGAGYVLADCSVERATPDGWARAALTAWRRFEADRIVAEVNQGGDLIETLLRTHAPDVPFKAVRATRGKYTRAEPVAALYEQGRVRHVGGFTALEDQMCSYLPGHGSSPDRLDALVWALTDLMLAQRATPGIRSLI